MRDLPKLTMMHAHQSDLKNWFNAALGRKCENLQINGKCLDHLIGVDRCLGTFLSFFFFKRGELTSVVETMLSRLVIVARGFIVVDDAIRDHDDIGLSPSTLREIREILSDFCLELLCDLTNDHEVAVSMLKRRLSAISYTYDLLQSGVQPSFKTAYGKCALLSLPFDCLKTQFNENEMYARELLAIRALFLLQLADDYADVHHDLQTKINSNLFSWAYARSKPVQHFCDDKKLLKFCAEILIDVMAQELEDFGEPELPISDWAKKVREFLGFPSNRAGADYVKNLFGENLPKGFKVPCPENGFVYTSNMRQNIGEPNQVNISAELIHKFATKSVLENIIS